MNFQTLPIVVLVLALVSLAVGNIIGSSRQARGFEPEELVEKKDLVIKALRCIRGEKCAIPNRKYARLMMEAGPSLLMYGKCPPRTCSYEEEEKGKQLLYAISRRYPHRLNYTYAVVRNRMGK